MHIVEKSGVDLGPGVITAILGGLLVLVGLDAIVHDGVTSLHSLAKWDAIATLFVIGAYVLRFHVFREDAIRGPYLGAYIVVVGAAMAGVASVLMQRAKPAD